MAKPRISVEVKITVNVHACLVALCGLAGLALKLYFT
jgi:hypothetical protein